MNYVLRFTERCSVLCSDCEAAVRLASLPGTIKRYGTKQLKTSVHQQLLRLAWFTAAARADIMSCCNSCHTAAALDLCCRHRRRCRCRLCSCCHVTRFHALVEFCFVIFFL